MAAILKPNTSLISIFCHHIRLKLAIQHTLIIQTYYFSRQSVFLYGTLKVPSVGPHHPWTPSLYDLRCCKDVKHQTNKQSDTDDWLCTWHWCNITSNLISCFHITISKSQLNNKKYKHYDSGDREGPWASCFSFPSALFLLIKLKMSTIQ